VDRNVARRDGGFPADRGPTLLEPEWWVNGGPLTHPTGLAGGGGDGVCTARSSAFGVLRVAHDLAPVGGRVVEAGGFDHLDDLVGAQAALDEFALQLELRWQAQWRICFAAPPISPPIMAIRAISTIILNGVGIPTIASMADMEWGAGSSAPTPSFSRSRRANLPGVRIGTCGLF
jgi:hypothetical protein